MRDQTELKLSQEDYDIAMCELSFILDILVSSVNDLVGPGAAGVGRLAGKCMARKQPFHFVEPQIQEVLEALKQRLQGGFELSFRCEGTDTEIEIGRCAIRDVCVLRSKEIGGELCELFHHYLTGMVGELMRTRVRGKILSVGDSCLTHLQAV